VAPPQQILQSEPDCILPTASADNFSENLNLDDIVSQIGGVPEASASDLPPNPTAEAEPKVIVKCNYCPNFKSPLNSSTWENILNHILPVAKEELHTSFYGNILKHFARSLRVSVSGRGEHCEVVVSHGLVCRRTGTWYGVERPGVELATTLATHIMAVQPGVASPYGARPRGNSLICLFCLSPYTAEDYQRHLKPHQDFIVPCLLLAAGAYCATSFELDVRKTMACGSCQETEAQDLRFLPCNKFSTEFNCVRRLQSTVDCFRENFDSRGFLQVSNSAMTKCSVCRTPNNTYCALFKPNQATMLITGNPEETLSVCANCQKQFVNVVMRENSFEKQLKMFQLHHMEQLCGMLRVLLSASQPVAKGNHNLVYTVQEGGSLYSASSTQHSVLPAKLLVNPVLKTSKVEEDKSRDMSGPCIRYICEQCKFSIDLTRLQHQVGKEGLGHLVDMSIGVVLEHIVPHTESLLAVIMTAAFNEVFKLKFEFVAQVEGEGNSKKINISLDRKIVPNDGKGEVVITKDIHKNVEVLKQRLRQDKKGNVCIKRKHLFMPDNSVYQQQDQEQQGQLMEVSRFLEAATPVLQLYGSSGCNTKLLDYYSECRLCSKFSFPDFKLTAAIRAKDGVALCENCCETILSLCVPSEPEKVSGRGEVCLLLGIEKNTGHRLVLSNNSKKWISADGVDKIQAVSELAASSSIPDYGTSLVQLLRSHLQAVSERAWSDPSCLVARAGFCVSDPQKDLGQQLDEVTGQPRQNPIEVKVSIRPPKPKTPPPKLMITSVQARGIIQKTGSAQSSGASSSASTSTASPSPVSVTPGPSGPSPGSKLVKITANRRIIPVRDPTSIPSPPQKTTSAAVPHLPQAKNIPRSRSDAETKAKIAALRESLKFNNKNKPQQQTSRSVPDIENNTVSPPPKLPASTTITEAVPVHKKPPPLKPGATTLPEDDSDLEGEDDFESIDAIADFINSSEPPQKPVNPQNSDLKKLSSLLGSGSKKSSEPSGVPSLDLCGDVEDEFTDSSLANRTPRRDRALSDIEASGITISPSSLIPEEVRNSGLKLPPGLNISKASVGGMVKIQSSGSNLPAKVIDLGPELPSSILEAVPDGLVAASSSSPNLVPSPASDATTSTKDMTGAKNKKPPYMPRLLPRQEELMAGEKLTPEEKTSTVKTNSEATRKETELTEHEKEHLTNLLSGDTHLTGLLDLDLDSDPESESASPPKERKPGGGTKLASILPKPRGRPPKNFATRASSSNKGKSGLVEKRKRDTEASAEASTKAKKAKLEEEFEAVAEEAVVSPKRSPKKKTTTKEKSKSHARVRAKEEGPSSSEATTSSGQTYKSKPLRVDIPPSESQLAGYIYAKISNPQDRIVSLAKQELAKSTKITRGVKNPVETSKSKETKAPVIDTKRVNLTKTVTKTTSQSGNEDTRGRKEAKIDINPAAERSRRTPLNVEKPVEITPLKPVDASSKTPTSKDQRGPQVTDFIKGTSSSGRIRKTKKMFDI